MKTVLENVKRLKISDGEVGICYLGQEGFLFDNGESKLCIDPYLSTYVDDNCCQYVKWERLYPSPIEPLDFGFADCILCTHSHYDHADPVTLSAAAKNNPETVFVIPAPEVDTVASYGIEKERIIPARAFEHIAIRDFEVIPIPSAHEEIHKDGNGDCFELGYIVKTKGKTFFHAGDMCMYDGLVEALKKFDIDVAFLPINGRDYFRNKNDIIGNFNCDEAVLLSREIGARLLVPMHHDLYAVNGVSMTEFLCALDRHDRGRPFFEFEVGEIFIFK